MCARSKRRCLICTPGQHNRCSNSTLPGSQATPRARALPRPSKNLASTVKRDKSSPSASSLATLPSSSCPLPLSSSTSSSSVQCEVAPRQAAAGVKRCAGVTLDASGAAGTTLRTKACDSDKSKNVVMRTGLRTPHPPAPSKPTAEGAIGEAAFGASHELSSRTPSALANDDVLHQPLSRSALVNDGPENCTKVAAKGPTEPSLPPFSSAAEIDFRWGSRSGEEFAHAVHCAYTEIVHWRRNIFLVPSGKAGKQFIKELTSLLNAYAQGSALESIALEAAMTTCTLLLQKPHPTSKARDHVNTLERRLRAWQDGDVDGLMREGRTIQQHLPINRRTESDLMEQNTRIFSKLVFEGKIQAALRFLSNNHGGGVLGLDDMITEDRTVMDALRDKHPEARPMQAEALVTSSCSPPDVHPVLFERLTGSSIRTAALRSQGAAGPSGVDAAGWQRICTAFRRDSADLCEAIAAVGRRLCTDLVDPTPLQALLACRLIPLDKRPGVRPIGICEVLRRILGKAITAVIKEDVMKATGPLQLCGGHEAGCEAAIQTMRMVFEDPSTDAIIFVDASNAFNNLNRKVALYNIQFLCPVASKILINCYRSSTALYVGGTVIRSQEGTTQGDPLAMMMFALATVPLLNAVKTADTIQAWFADDAASGGCLRPLRIWWDALVRKGPAFGYYVNAGKTMLMVKPEKSQEANEVFGDTGVQITTNGKLYLGGYLGPTNLAEQSLSRKIEEWISEVECLAKHGKSQPHAAFAALTHGLVCRWVYAMRISNCSSDDIFQPLEMALSQVLIPILTGQAAPSASMRALLALPTRFGGMGILNPTTTTIRQQEASRKVCAPLVKIILEQEGDALYARHQQESIKRNLRRLHANQMKTAADNVLAALGPMERQCAMAAQEKGTSAWLAAIPIQRHGFALTKGQFWDAIALRYGWQLRMTPQNCRCGADFTINHSLTCKQGGWHSIRHDDLRDTLTSLLSEVCREVTKEPHLQPLSGEQLPLSANKANDARLDIRAHGFWNESQDAFFDVRVFYPFASSYSNKSMSSLYRQHEQQKRREYGQRVREVEHGGFTPLVFSTAGGTAPEATIFLKRLASLLSEKRDESYSATMGWLRCITSFCLLRTSLRCVRASPRRGQHVDLDCITEAVASSRLAV